MLLEDLSNFQGVVAIVPAAGIGKRMNSDLPKQYLQINNKTILELTINQLLKFSPIKLIVLALSANDKRWIDCDFAKYKQVVVVDGGKERADSVLNGLCFLDDTGLPDNVPIMVHDAARPCITEADLNKLFESFKQDHYPKMLAGTITDTIQQIDENGLIDKTIPRSSLVKALTPQISEFNQLFTALKQAKANKQLITDEASALKLAGHKVGVVMGNLNNIKITHPSDLELAEFILSKSQ